MATLVDAIESARASQAAVLQNLQAASAAQQAGDFQGAAAFRSDAAAASLAASKNVAALADQRRGEILAAEAQAMAARQPLPQRSNTLLTVGVVAAAGLGAWLLLRRRRGGRRRRR